MHDNECWEPGQELEKAIKALAKAWRDMLRRSDAELGIDAEYSTRGRASRRCSDSCKTTSSAARRPKTSHSTGGHESPSVRAAACSPWRALALRRGCAAVRAPAVGCHLRLLGAS